MSLLIPLYIILNLFPVGALTNIGRIQITFFSKIITLMCVLVSENCSSHKNGFSFEIISGMKNPNIYMRRNIIFYLRTYSVDISDGYSKDKPTNIFVNTSFCMYDQSIYNMLFWRWPLTYRPEKEICNKPVVIFMEQFIIFYFSCAVMSPWCWSWGWGKVRKISPEFLGFYIFKLVWLLK